MTAETKIMDIVLVSLYGNSEYIKCVDEIGDDPDWTPLSEPVAVAFDMLPQSEIVAGKLRYLDREEERKRAAYQADMEKLQQRRRELLAIEHQPNPDDEPEESTP